MVTANQNSPEVLSEEILAEARRESEALVQGARKAAEDLLAKAAAEAAKVRQERLDQARGEAARRKELILATVSVESGRLRAARAEALLDSIHETVRQWLASRDRVEYREILVRLAVEALNRMAGDSFVVKLSVADQGLFGTGLADEIRRRAGRSPLNIGVTGDSAITENGVIVADAEGRQVWDNRLPARLQRLWPELRRLVAVNTSLLPGGGSKGDAA